MLEKRYLFLLVIPLLLLSFFAFESADAYTKSVGKKNPVTNHKLVCGDELCNTPVSISEKIKRFLEAHPKDESGLDPQSTFAVGGVAQQGTKMKSSVEKVTPPTRESEEKEPSVEKVTPPTRESEEKEPKTFSQDLKMTLDIPGKIKEHDPVVGDIVKVEKDETVNFELKVKNEGKSIVLYEIFSGFVVFDSKGKQVRMHYEIQDLAEPFILETTKEITSRTSWNQEIVGDEDKIEIIKAPSGKYKVKTFFMGAEKDLTIEIGEKR